MKSYPKADKNAMPPAMMKEKKKPAVAKKMIKPMKMEKSSMKTKS